MEETKIEFKAWMKHLGLNTTKLAAMMGYKNRVSMTSGKKFQKGELQRSFVAICEAVNAKPKKP